MKNRASNYRLVINVKPDYEKRSSCHTLRTSVRRRPAPANFAFKSAVLKLPHLNQVVQHQKYNKAAQHGQSNTEEGQLQRQLVPLQQQSPAGLAFHGVQNGEKQQQRQNEKKKVRQYQYNQYDRYEQQLQGHATSSELSKRSDSQFGTQEHDWNIDTANGSTIDPIMKGSSPSVQQAKQRKEYKEASILVTNVTSLVLIAL